jgi:hypothetical protein
MNERIKELAEQAGSTHKQSLGVYQFYGDELEKFAELIVKECAMVCESVTDPGTPLHLVSLGYAQKLKQHFGVES